MFSILLALAAQLPAPDAPQTPVRHMPVLHMPTTGAAVRLDLPELLIDEAVTAAMKRRHANRGILQGQLRGESSVMVMSAYDELHPSAAWRDILMAGRLAGLGRFDVGTTACTESLRDLEPPYSNVAWHAFITMGDTCFDVTIGTLAKDGVSPISRADFERIIGEARYAILRLGAWDEMPPAVLEHMHTGLARVENDGAKYLAELAKTEKDGWACALAAAEVGGSLRMPAAERLALYERVIADISKLEKPGEQEAFALMTAMSGRALMLRDEGRVADALAEITKTMALPAAKKPLAETALSYIAATIHAQNKDAASAVASLKKAIDGDPDRRAFALRDNAFAPIGENEALRALVKPRK